MKRYLSIFFVGLSLAGFAFADDVSIAGLTIARDKALHLGVSFGLGLASSSMIDDEWTAFGVCSAFGLAKEAYDEYDYGGADGEDMAYNLLGCGLGLWLQRSLNTSSQREVSLTPDVTGAIFNVSWEL